ncbi:MAG TPA: PLP-dependent transferase, partial [Solirubrobacteraceae bacterium]|nr:PLP-dependent transferase [Solirubrobacteraceae bacterium]
MTLERLDADRRSQECGPDARTGTPSFATRAVHAGLDPDPAFGSIIPAIHQTSTFVQPHVNELVAGYDYARAVNPTRTALENALGALEGGEASAFASGMA